MAYRHKLEISERLSFAILPRPPNNIAAAEKLAKPHRAKVIIAVVRSDKGVSAKNSVKFTDATNSFSTHFGPINVAALNVSSHGIPIITASGENK